MDERTPRPMTRRCAARVVGGTALALPIALKARDSSARRVWRRTEDATTNEIWEDPNGDLGQGLSTKTNERIQFRTNEMDIGVRLSIPASRNDMRIMLEYAPGPIAFTNGDPNPAPVWASAVGRGNSWITLRSTLPYTARRLQRDGSEQR